MSGALAMMIGDSGTAPVLVGYASAQGPPLSALNIAKPTGVAAGDIMVAFLSGLGTWTEDAGWTEAVDSNGCAVAWKIATGAEGSSYNFNNSSTLGRTGGVILAYRGGTFDVVSAAGTASGGSACVAPTATLTRAGLLLAAYSIDNASRTFTAPTGMVSVFADSDSTIPSLAIFSQEAGAGAAGTRSATPSGGGNSVGFLIGIKGA